MRIWRGFAALALVASALAAAAAPSHAQSVMQRFFGYERSQEPEYDRWSGRPYGFNRYRSRRDYDDDYRGSGGGGGWQEDYSAYSTVCVRMCDGYYFPISFSVRRGQLYKDSRTCMRRCDGEAKLFYYKTDGGSVETMVDMAGRPYSEIPNAFRYRKALVNGCTCKPAPWSEEAKARHQTYAAEDAQSKANAEIAEDDRIEREARIAESQRSYEDSYGSDERGYDEYQRPPPQNRPQFYSRWRRDRWDDVPIEAPYDH